MIRLSKVTWECVAITLLVALLLGYRGMQFSYIDGCIRNWDNEAFISLTGECVSVTYNAGRPGSKYSLGINSNHQFLTGQGWHLQMWNGADYYIPETICDEILTCSRDILSALESKEITIRCLTPTHLLHCNIIVSLEYGDTEYLNAGTTYAYLEDARKGGFRGIICVFIPFALFTVVMIGIDVSSLRTKKKKEKLKQEKMQRLRDEGKLHPKKQIQKK